MGAKDKKVLEVVSGWEAVDLVAKCIFFGVWQLLQIFVKRLWKGHRRKLNKESAVEVTVDSSVGTHCYIKIMGVKYHYVKTGPKSNQLVLILGDAPDTGKLWSPTWTRVVRRLAENGYHIVTLDLRGTGGSEGSGRRDLAPPRAIEELSTLMQVLGVSENNPAVVIGFGIGGMLAWYLAHCHGRMISKMAVVAAPHPNLYWQYPPTAFCNKALHFLQWPHFPEQLLAEGALGNREGVGSSRACDWAGPLNYVRGAAWWRIRPNHRIAMPALLVGARHSAAELVTSAQHCLSSTLRMVCAPDPTDPEVAALVLDFLIEKDKSIEGEPKSLMGRMLSIAGRGRELTAKLVLPPVEA